MKSVRRHSPAILLAVLAGACSRDHSILHPQTPEAGRAAPIPSRAEFQKRLDSRDKWEAGHAKRFLARLDAGETLPTSYPCPVQVVRFGADLVLAAIGGETCVDYSLRLSPVWVAGYSNDVMAYIPSRRVREEGGYEAAGAMRFSSTHPGPWAPTLEEKIVGKGHELDRSLGR